MELSKPDVDIARNLRTIEWLKVELLGSLAALFKALLSDSEERILDALANLMVGSYILARRLGISFSRLGTKVQNKVKANIEQDHEIEKWYGDFSALLHYLENDKR
ncbi:MAG: MazG-like family protein [Limnochordia bacterium]